MCCILGACAGLARHARTTNCGAKLTSFRTVLAHRTQKLDGVLIAQHGASTSKTITFRRVFQGVGVELIIPVHAPALHSVELVRRGRVRRSKLFYLRERIGRAAKLTEVVGAKGTAAAKAAEAAKSKPAA